MLFVVPNMFLVGSIFFGLVAFSRQVFTTYAGSILLFIGYLLGSTLSQDLENKHLVNLLDPFGSYAYDAATKYWSPVEQNALLAPLEGDLLTNRLIWAGVGLLVFILTIVRFSFSRFLAVKLGRASSRRGSLRKKGKTSEEDGAVPSLASLPHAKACFSDRGLHQADVSAGPAGVWQYCSRPLFHCHSDRCHIISLSGRLVWRTNFWYIVAANDLRDARSAEWHLFLLCPDRPDLLYR
jgi:hypothetical protein